MKRIKVVMLSCVLLVFMVMGNLTGVLAADVPVTFTAPIDLVSPDGEKATVNCTFVVIEEQNGTAEGKVQVGDGTNSAIDQGTSGDITIPDTVINDGKTYKVTVIGKQAFMSVHGLTSTGLANNTTVETLDESAFSDCTGLISTELETNATVKTLGKEAFVNCSKIELVLIPAKSSIISIGDMAFNGCIKLDFVLLNNNNIPEIGIDAFSNNTIIYYPEGAANGGNLDGYNVKPFKIHSIKVDELSLAKNYTEGDTFTLEGLKFKINHDTEDGIINKPDRVISYHDRSDEFTFTNVTLKAGKNTIKYSYLGKEYSFEITALASVPETGNVNDKTILINLLGISGLGLVALAFRKKRFVK